MFEFLRMGIFYFAAGMAYNFLLVRRLPARGDPSSLTGKYQLSTYLTEVRVPESSPLVGRTVVDEKISDKYHLNVLEIVRGTRKIAFDLRSTPVEPGAVHRYRIDLIATSNVFLAGHRLRVEISSSNFPRFSRNLNTGEPSELGTATRPAAQTVYHDAERASHILLPVVPRTSAGEQRPSASE